MSWENSLSLNFPRLKVRQEKRRSLPRRGCDYTQGHGVRADSGGEIFQARKGNFEVSWIIFEQSCIVDESLGNIRIIASILRSMQQICYTLRDQRW